MCADCEARREMAREALLSAKLGAAATHIAKGVAEAVGLKSKTGVEELEAGKKPAKKRKS